MREGGESFDEAREHVAIQRKDVEVEVKRLSRLDGLAVEVAGAKDEGTGLIGETAGSFAVGSRLEYFGVIAGDAFKNDAEGAAQCVGGFAGRSFAG